MWTIERVHDDVGDLVYTAIVHVIGEIVEMEEPVEEIAAYAELGITAIRVTHRSKLPGLEATKGTTSSFIEVGITIKYPSFRLDGDEFVVSAQAKVKRTVYDEVRK